MFKELEAVFKVVEPVDGVVVLTLTVSHRLFYQGLFPGIQALH